MSETLYVIDLDPSDNTLRGKYHADSTVLARCNATNAAFTILLPTVEEGGRNRFIFFKSDASGNSVVIADSAGTVQGTLSAQGIAVEFVTDGAVWVRLGSVYV